MNTLRVLDPEASARLHNAQCKQFSLGLLQLRKAAQAMAYNVEDGEHALWRIAVMGEDAERITVLIQEGLRFRVGSIVFWRQRFIIPNSSILGLILSQQRH